MKRWTAILALALPLLMNAATYGFVNSKTIIEESKLGKQEQASFEALRKQMESVLEEKEKELNDMATKFSDPDFLDTLSVEAETELKRKFRQQTQEFQEKQNQFYQALQQSNLKVMTKIGESIAKAAEAIAKEKKLDAVFNYETTFYAQDALDISKDIVTQMDKQFDQEAASAKTDATKK